MTKEEAKKYIWKLTENPYGTPSDIIDRIYNEFEFRTCVNCKFYVNTKQKNHICNLNHDIWHLDRGCEQWEQK